jgi:hypothetical protein
MSAAKTLPIGSDLPEPASENEPMEQWQAWTLQECHAAEDFDNRLMRRAFNAGKGLTVVREKFRQIRTELKRDGKPLKSQETWTRWYKKHHISTGTISRYVHAYDMCRKNPEWLKLPLTDLANFTSHKECAEDEPLPLGEERWVTDRTKAGTNSYVDVGDKVGLVSVDGGQHHWMVLSGTNRGKTFYLRPHYLSETPYERPKKESTTSTTREKGDSKVSTKADTKPVPKPKPEREQVGSTPKPEPPASKKGMTMAEVLYAISEGDGLGIGMVGKKAYDQDWWAYSAVGFVEMVERHSNDLRPVAVNYKGLRYVDHIEDNGQNHVFRLKAQTTEDINVVKLLHDRVEGEPPVDLGQPEIPEAILGALDTIKKEYRLLSTEDKKEVRRLILETLDVLMGEDD